MTSQEAIIKNDITYTDKQKYSELFFPSLNSTLHSILTGDVPTLNKINPKDDVDTNQLSTKYNDYLLQNNLENMKINLLIDDDYLFFVGHHVLNEDQSENQNKTTLPTYNEQPYLALSWTDDLPLIEYIAQCMNLTLMDCCRTLLAISTKTRDYKNIHSLNANPLYDQMAFIYAMYTKINQLSNLPRCYMQILMNRKHTTFNSIYAALKYVVTIPDSMVTFMNGNNVSQVYYEIEPKMLEDGTMTEREVVDYYKIEFIDYTGMKFSHKLRFRVGPKRIQQEGSRFINSGVDDMLNTPVNVTMS